MEPEFEAILGHRSAHSLATGPVMAEPTNSGKISTNRRPIQHGGHRYATQQGATGIFSKANNIY